MGKYIGMDTVCPHGGAKLLCYLDRQEEVLLTAADTELLSAMSIGTTVTSLHFEPSSLCTWTSIRWQVRGGYEQTKTGFVSDAKILTLSCCPRSGLCHVSMVIEKSSFMYSFLSREKLRQGRTRWMEQKNGRKLLLLHPWAWIWIIDQTQQEGHLPLQLNPIQTCKRKKQKKTPHFYYFIDIYNNTRQL